MKYLLFVLLLGTANAIFAQTDESADWISVGMSQNVISNDQGLLENGSDKVYGFDFHYARHTKKSPFTYQLGIVNSHPLGSHFYTFGYLNLGIVREWKFIRVAAFLGPSFTFKSYRISEGPDFTYFDRISKQGFGINQQAMLVFKVIKNIGIGASVNMNFSKAGNSKGKNIIIQVGL